MPRFTPFVGLRYRNSDLSRLVCPPYDVISEPQRLALLALDDHNCVRVEMPSQSAARYEEAASTLARWRSADGPLGVDDGPSFYIYRMAADGRTTTGVLGALGLEAPGSGILPHEHTTPKDKQDRLDLLTATRANLSPIWGLSLASGLSKLCASVTDPPVSTAVADGVSHTLWRVTDATLLEAMSETVASAPVVVADGHHRFQVALAYQDRYSQPGPQDAVLCYVVELSPDELAVAPIHRLLTGLSDPTPLQPWFEATPTSAPDHGLAARMADAGSLGLVSATGTWLLRPRRSVMNTELDLDSSRLDVALAALPDVSVRYQHGQDEVVEAVRAGTADAAVLLRPATVAQIADVAHRGERMPPKTTFFTPKPATGMVFRALDDQPA